MKEKFGDYLMDISKYVFTAVMLTTLFNDPITGIGMKCIVGIFFSTKRGKKWLDSLND